MKTKITYNQKILNTLSDYIILKLLNRSERHLSYGTTGKEIILRLRALGVEICESSIYNILSHLRRDNLITKGLIETDYNNTEVAYYISKQGEKYLKSTKEFLEAIL